MNDVVGPDAQRFPDSVARTLALSGSAAVLAAVAIILALEVRGATDGMNLLRRTISHHALETDGWLFDLAVALLAVGSIGLIAALLARGVVPLRSGATLAIGLWPVGLLLVAVFTKHDWSVGPSASGYLHWAGTLVAFLSLPVGVLLLGGRWRTDARWGRHARIARLLGVASLICFTPLVIAIGVHVFDGTPWWRVIPLGLVERLLASTEILAVLAVGHWAISASRSRSLGVYASGGT